MKASIDLLRLGGPPGPSAAWTAGAVVALGDDPAPALAAWAEGADGGDFGVVWPAGAPLPDPDALAAVAASGADLAHGGLARGAGRLLPDLRMVKHDWSMLDAPAERSSSSWRMAPAGWLVRRDLLRRMGGLDGAYASAEAAALDLGLRCMAAGAVVEHRPELAVPGAPLAEPPARDLYAFLLRHYHAGWARYFLARRCLRGAAPWRERAALAEAAAACARVSPPGRGPVWYEPSPLPVERLREAGVTVIIPTLGRYPYLPEALESLRRQTVRPREVVVVDQNPPESRQPEVYRGYDDLRLRVVWQDERGQSLARNTGLAEAREPYVFLFDDDSVAHDDLIEQHLRVVLGGRFAVSTGVAYPPPPTGYRLPEAFRHPRVAQTFDTGNALLPTALARALGGLDRNYDFGPGTDSDFGTRLYLSGVRIAHNPSAARIHYKAPMGGLRVHGAKKYNTDAGLLEPFPPVTQSYYALRYLTPGQRFERALLFFVSGRTPRGGGAALLKGGAKLAVSAALLPLKHRRSLRRARDLLAGGPRLAVFDDAPPPGVEAR